MMSDKPIKTALGRGERLQISDGVYVECAPARLADLEDVLELYSKSLGRVTALADGRVQYGLTIQGCYVPENRDEAKPAFEELLYLACGRKVDKKELLEKITIADGGKEVVDFIDRFLGFEPRNATAEAQQE